MDGRRGRRPSTSDNVRYVALEVGNSEPRAAYTAAPMATKNCFIDKSRPCDLTCKAAFPIDDAVDPVDCYFIWLATHVGESAFDFRRVIEGRFGPGDDTADEPGGGPSGPHTGPLGGPPGGVSPN